MDAQVAIIGFGPVGATLACLLGMRGLKVAVIERERDVYALPRAAHIDHQGLRTLQEIQCLEALLPGMVRNRGLDLVNATRELLFRIPAEQDSVSGLPLSVYFYQPDFDRQLRSAAAGFRSVEVNEGAEMIGLDPGAEEVTLELRGPEGQARQLRASWVVGCDGAWSPVREACGLPLESLGFDEQWLVLDLLLTGPHADLPMDHVVQVCDPARPYLSTPISANRQRFEFMLLEGEDAEQMKQRSCIERLLAAWLAPGSFEVARAAVYTFHGLIRVVAEVALVSRPMANSRKAQVAALRIALLALALAAWEILSRSGLAFAEAVPSSVAIGKEMLAVPGSADFWLNLKVTLVEVAVAIAIGGAAGLLARLALGASAFLSRAYEPHLYFLSPKPKIIVFPVLILAFGTGMGSKIAWARSPVSSRSP